jgi:hypothetical protein
MNYLDQCYLTLRASQPAKISTGVLGIEEIDGHAVWIGPDTVWDESGPTKDIPVLYQDRARSMNGLWKSARPKFDSGLSAQDVYTAVRHDLLSGDPVVTTLSLGWHVAAHWSVEIFQATPTAEWFTLGSSGTMKRAKRPHPNDARVSCMAPADA